MLQKLVKRLLPVLFLLSLGCSNEPNVADTTDIRADKSIGGTIVNKTDEAGFELLDQQAVDLLSDKRLQFINYWATWCLPCLEEMPELADFREEHQEVVEVYAVNYDGLDVDQLRKEILALQVKIPALLDDPNRRLGYERPSVLPATVVMLDGQVKEVLIGPQTKQTLETVLEKWGT